MNEIITRLLSGRHVHAHLCTASRCRYISMHACGRIVRGFSSQFKEIHVSCANYGAWFDRAPKLRLGLNTVVAKVRQNHRSTTQRRTAITVYGFCELKTKFVEFKKVRDIYQMISILEQIKNRRHYLL